MNTKYPTSRWLHRFRITIFIGISRGSGIPRFPSALEINQRCTPVSKLFVTLISQNHEEYCIQENQIIFTIFHYGSYILLTNKHMHPTEIYLPNICDEYFCFESFCQEAVWPNRASLTLHGITCPLIGRSTFNIPTLDRLTNHQTKLMLAITVPFIIISECIVVRGLLSGHPSISESPKRCA